MVVVRGRLTPDAGAVLMQALAAARETLYRTRLAASPPGTTGAGEHGPAPVAPTGVEQVNDVRLPDPAAETPTMAQQQADALALLAESALHHGLDPGASGERYQVVVHVDAPALADPDQPGQSALEDAGRVPAETSRRLACDASRVVMRHDADGRVMEVGARTRTVPPALRRALVHRDRGCRFPGCGLRITQGHHIRHWASGGPTTLSNLTLRCRRHHRAVHEDRYQVDRDAGTLRFRRPDGRLLLDVPPRPAPPDDPVQALRSQHAAAGLEIGPRTGRPGWLGISGSIRQTLGISGGAQRRPLHAVVELNPPSADSRGRRVDERFSRHAPQLT